MKTLNQAHETKETNASSTPNRDKWSSIPLDNPDIQDAVVMAER